MNFFKVVNIKYSCMLQNHEVITVALVISEKSIFTMGSYQVHAVFLASSIVDTSRWQ